MGGPSMGGQNVGSQFGSGMGGMSNLGGAMTGGNMGAPQTMSQMRGGAGNKVGWGGYNGGMGGPVGYGGWSMPMGGMFGGGGMGGPMGGKIGYGGPSLEQPIGNPAPAPQGPAMSRMGGGTGGGVVAPPMTGGMGGPMPTAAPAAPGGVDHNANFAQLYAQNPQMANEYRMRSGDTAAWWANGGREQALKGQFGGDQGAMNNWINATSAQGGNVTPLDQAQLNQLNQMSGTRPPDWALNAYKQGRSSGQAVNPMYEQFL